MKKKILIVDDDQGIRDLVAEILTGNQFEVIQARNGAEALEKLKTATFSLVLSDMQMPQMGGLELLQKAKTMNPSIPFIILSGSLHEHNGTALIQHVHLYIEKPFNPFYLLESVLKYFRSA